MDNSEMLHVYTKDGYRKITKVEIENNNGELNIQCRGEKGKLHDVKFTLRDGYCETYHLDNGFSITLTDKNEIINNGLQPKLLYDNLNIFGSMGSRTESFTYMRKVLDQAPVDIHRLEFEDTVDGMVLDNVTEDMLEALLMSGANYIYEGNTITMKPGNPAVRYVYKSRSNSEKFDIIHIETDKAIYVNGLLVG